MIASLALCGAATGALIATNASAAGTPKKPVMVAMVTSPGLDMAAAPPGDDAGPMPPPPGMMGAMMGAPAGGQMAEHMKARMTQMCKDMYAHKVGEMAFLETRLALTPAQAPLFAKWKQVNLDIAQHHSGECDARIAKVEARKDARKAGERPSPIDRLSREEDMLKTRLANIEAEKPSLEALYNALTPDQRMALGRGGMGGHPMMGRMMGMMHLPGMGGPMGMGPMGGPAGGPMGPHGPADMPPPPPPQ
jgi:hypothetical protein